MRIVRALLMVVLMGLGGLMLVPIFRARFADEYGLTVTHKMSIVSEDYEGYGLMVKEGDGAAYYVECPKEVWEGSEVGGRLGWTYETLDSGVQVKRVHLREKP